MPWFKVTDTLMTDAKVIMMPVSERGLALGTWVACGTWSALNLTDGKVPSGIVESFVGSLDGAETLVRAKMWKRTRGGFAFINWDKYQYTREQVEDKREQERTRKAEARERARARRQVKQEDVPPMSQWDTDGTSAVSGIPVPTPTPTPTPTPSLPRPVPSGESSGGMSPKQRASEHPQQVCGRQHDPADSCGACGAARRRAKDDELAAQRAKAASERKATRAAQEARAREAEAARAEADADPDQTERAKAAAFAAIRGGSK